jgi:hypothetical protein
MCPYIWYANWLLLLTFRACPSPSLSHKSTITSIPTLQVKKDMAWYSKSSRNLTPWLLLELPLEFPDGTTPIASKVYIFHSSSSNWQTVAPPYTSRILAEINEGKATKYGKLGRRELEVVVAKVTMSWKISKSTNHITLLTTMLCEGIPWGHTLLPIGLTIQYSKVRPS